MDGLNARELPQPTRDLDRAQSDLDRAGYCLLAEALDAAWLAAVRGRLYEQALAEKQAGIAYFDGAAHQNWGTFRDRDGQPRAHAFSEADSGVNQRLWMLVNKGEEFLAILEHAGARAMIGHVLGDAYILSSFIANIANPGGVPMPLHTDQWWMPASAYRKHKVRVGSITRNHFEVDGEGPPAMIAPAACCNIMWMLDDFSEENGATRVVPGSHLSGRQPDPERDKNVATVQALAPAGTAMVFEGRLWHGTGANRSQDSRAGLLTTFCGPQFRPNENFIVGTRPAVLENASADLMELLGFRVWGGYGRIDTPLADFIDLGAPITGEMRPDQPAR